MKKYMILTLALLVFAHKTSAQEKAVIAKEVTTQVMPQEGPKEIEVSVEKAVAIPEAKMFADVQANADISTRMKNKFKKLEEGVKEIAVAKNGKEAVAKYQEVAESMPKAIKTTKYAQNINACLQALAAKKVAYNKLSKLTDNLKKAWSKLDKSQKDRVIALRSALYAALSKLVEYRDELGENAQDKLDEVVEELDIKTLDELKAKK